MWIWPSKYFNSLIIIPRLILFRRTNNYIYIYMPEPAKNQGPSSSDISLKWQINLSSNSSECVIDKIFLAVTYLWHLFILLLCAYRFIVLHILQLYNFGPLDLNWTNYSGFFLFIIRFFLHDLIFLMIERHWSFVVP